MSSQTDDAIVEWIGRLGAASAVDVSNRFGLEPRTARARLATCVRARRLRAVRLLHDEPALYVATRAGLVSVQLEALTPCRVSASSFAHLGACARVAVALARNWPDARLASERELRLAERRAGTPVASAELASGRDGEPVLHRPDLVLFGDSGSVAIEVELTVKAPRRLREIARAWGRSRLVDGVVYFAAPAPARAVRRAVEAVQAGDRITVVDLGRLVDPAPGETTAVAPSEAIAVAA